MFLMSRGMATFWRAVVARQRTTCSPLRACRPLCAGRRAVAKALLLRQSFVAMAAGVEGRGLSVFGGWLRGQLVGVQRIE